MRYVRFSISRLSQAQRAVLRVFSKILRVFPRDRNTVGIPPRATTPVQTGTGPSAPLISIWSQKMQGLRRPIITQEVRNDDPLVASIIIITSKHRDPMPIWSKLIVSKTANESSANVYVQCWINLASDTVLSKSPNFIDLRLSSVDATDELGSVFASTTRIGLATHGSGWLLYSRFISETTADRLIGTKEKNHYNFKSKFETRRDKVVDQYFGCQNDPMS